MRILNIIGLGLASSLFISFAAKSQSESAGERWQKIDVATAASFRGLSVVDDKIVWASGTDGTVIRTTDGGSTWSVRTGSGAEKLDFRSIHAFDVNTAVIASAGNAEDGQARIYRTANGGQSWKLVYQQETPGIFFDAIAFWDRSRGIVLSDPVNGHFALFVTEDGGETWKQPPPNAIPPALSNEGAFAASNSCVAVEGTSDVWFVTGGANIARVFRSTDRGRSWTVADTPIHPKNASTGLFSIAFRDARTGIAVGGDYAKPTESPTPTILTTSDGGATWQPAPEQNPAGLFFSAVTYEPASAKSKSKSDKVIAGGSGGIVSKLFGASWTRESDENINALVFSPYGAAWAVGPKGTILHRNR